MTFNDFLMNNFNIESCSTFWEDFSIADHFGTSAIKETYTRSKYWVCNYKMWTELVIVLNTKCWNYYNKGNYTLSKIYSELYYDARDAAYDNFNEEEQKYFIELTD